MRALWSDRQNCSHNVSQKVKRIGLFSEKKNTENREGTVALSGMALGEVEDL